MDATSGRILAEHASQQPVAMASLTKVMTALVALERGTPELSVTVVPEDLVGESSAGLRSGQELSLRTLLYGLLLRSGNDAAMAIARAVGGSPHKEDSEARRRFVWWMNETAVRLGMTRTHFQNPHGLDEGGHYSSAADLALLTRTALQNPELVEILGARSFEGEGFVWRHTNRLPERYPGIIAGKTGWTDDAGLCLIEVAERAGQRLIVVLLGSTFGSWYDDASVLLDYGWTLIDPLTEPADAERLFTWWWQRVDGPVAQGEVQRSWLWGQPLGPVEWEPYEEGPGGYRMVRYYDKGRMELTRPGEVVDARWRVTGGRLAWELISGWRQVGDTRFDYSGPARIPVAGDPSSPVTYAVLNPLLSQEAGEPGSWVTQWLTSNGTLRSGRGLERYGVRYGKPFAETGHGVASVFESWFEQSALVWVDGRLREEPLFFSWLTVVGFPITEPYWVRVPVGGVERDVLVQCFERRCLTFTPSNPVGWQIEMGNTGLHYRLWMRGTQLGGAHVANFERSAE